MGRANQTQAAGWGGRESASSLVTPAQGSYLPVVRVLAQCSVDASRFTVDKLLDLGLAVSEVAADLITMGGANRLEMRVSRDASSSVHTSLRVDAHPPPQAPQVLRPLTAHILSATTASYRLEEDSSGVQVELTFRPDLQPTANGV